MGSETERYHQNVAAFLQNQIDHFDHLILFGKGMKYCMDAFPYAQMAFHTEDYEKLIRHLEEQVRPEDAVFLKGSRLNRLERILQYWIDNRKDLNDVPVDH